MGAARDVVTERMAWYFDSNVDTATDSVVSCAINVSSPAGWIASLRPRMASSSNALESEGRPHLFDDRALPQSVAGVGRPSSDSVAPRRPTAGAGRLRVSATRFCRRDRKLPLLGGAGTTPALRLGTLKPDAAETRNATSTALEAGFRHLDCSERYSNPSAAQ